MKSYFLHQHRSLTLHLLFGAAVIGFVLLANISYGAIVVDLVHVETSQYPTIQVYVTVVDGTTGDPIPDLTEDNFSIFEDEKEQTVKRTTYIPAPDDPVAIAQALDYSGSMVKKNGIASMETGALLLIDQLRAEPPDACEILKFDLDVVVEQDFTTNKTLLIAAVNEDWFTEWGGTHLYDALYKAAEDTVSYITSPEGSGSMGSVVVISDGRDFEEFGPGSFHSLGEVIDLAASNEIRIFAIGLGDVYEEVLQRLADETDGGYFWAPEPGDFETIFGAIVAVHFGGGYIVSYATSATGCEDHKLQIVVNKNGDSGEDTVESFLICPPSKGGGGGGDGGNGCSMSNPEGQTNISHPVILVGIFALGLLVWRKRRRR